MTAKRKPGEFKAVCRLPEKKLYADLTPDEHRLVEQQGGKADYDKKLGGHAVPIRCTHEFAERDLFEGHMNAEHGIGTGGLHQRHRHSKPYTVGARVSAPRMSEEGAPFEPKGLDPGATVMWKQIDELGDGAPREWVERSGQVWSGGWAAKSVWVIPFEPLPGEAAVLVTAECDGLRHHSTQLRRPQRVA